VCDPGRLSAPLIGATNAREPGNTRWAVPPGPGIEALIDGRLGAEALFDQVADFFW
jgi:hypothetical protein